jgi:hypothetical protein
MKPWDSLLNHQFILTFLSFLSFSVFSSELLPQFDLENAKGMQSSSATFIFIGRFGLSIQLAPNSRHSDSTDFGNTCYPICILQSLHQQRPCGRETMAEHRREGLMHR